MASCATGIDITERVTAADVKRSTPQATPEQLFLADIEAQPLGQWSRGKRFFVTDERIKLVLGNTAPDYPLAGTYITYDYRADAVSPSGEPVVDLHFVTSQGDRLIYRTSATADTDRSIDIPFAIEESIVSEVSRRMLGNTYYIITPDRFTLAGDYRRCPKYVPVNVAAVHPGNDVYPVALKLVDAASPSATAADTTMVYMNVATPSSARTFSTLFSISDPRMQHRQISDETWRAIVANRVVEGMTTDECRLALGKPSSIDRRNTGAFIIEYWTYDGGQLLRFDDGVLRSFRR